jgi:hypothetical protein
MGQYSSECCQRCVTQFTKLSPVKTPNLGWYRKATAIQKSNRKRFYLMSFCKISLAKAPGIAIFQENPRSIANVDFVK